MIETFTVSAKPIPSPRVPFSPQEFLIYSVGCTLAVLYVQWLWSRRKLYTYANKVHGPFALPIVGCFYLFIGQPTEMYKNFQYLFNKYSGLAKLWFGHRLFFTVQTPKHLDAILSSPIALQKDPLYDHMTNVIGTGLFTARVPKWKKHRKLISPTFNQRILDQFVEVFSEQAEIMTKCLEKEEGKVVDLYHYFTKLTLDFICETAMGIKVNAQTTDSPYGKWVDRLMEITFLKIFRIWFHSDFIFNLTPLRREYDDLVRKAHDFSGKVVREKRIAYKKKMEEINECPEAELDEMTKRKAFLDYLIEMTYTKKGSLLTDQELREEVDTFMIAGSDTTATTNCFIFMVLGMFPEVQQKIYEEVIDVIGHEKKVEPSDLSKFKYTERVIKETLRVFPVGPFIVRILNADLDLGDVVLPEGSATVLGIINVHRNPEYWEDPLKFNPDRFLPENSEKIIPGSYLPFSGGARNCIGPRYAMMAMKTVVATVVRKYRVACDYKCIEDVDLKCNLVLRPTDGFKVSFHRK